MQRNTHDYIAVYEKDPFSVSLEVLKMKNGTYLVEGNASDENWHKVCEQAKVKPLGKFYAKIEITKSRHEIAISGQMKFSMNRECVRTLKEFILDEDVSFNESLPLLLQEGDSEDDLFTDEILQVADFLAQQVVLSMEQYPIHPDSLTTSRGEFKVLDNLQEEVDEEKNPFSVLKSLKKN